MNRPCGVPSWCEPIRGAGLARGHGCRYVATREAFSYRLAEEAGWSAPWSVVVDVKLDNRTTAAQARREVRELVTNGVPVKVRFVTRNPVVPL